MRRLGIALAMALVAVGIGSTPAQASDVGIVSATAQSVGPLVCSPEPITIHLDFTGTLAAAGKTYAGGFTTDVGGTYVNGPCFVKGPSHLRAFLTTTGPVSGQSLLGTVSGTCGGSQGDTFEAFPAAGGLLIVEPHDLGVLHLSCQVSVNGGPLTAIRVDANLVGPVVPATGSLVQLGAYTTP